MWCCRVSGGDAGRRTLDGLLAISLALSHRLRLAQGVHSALSKTLRLSSGPQGDQGRQQVEEGLSAIFQKEAVAPLGPIAVLQ